MSETKSDIKSTDESENIVKELAALSAVVLAIQPLSPSGLKWVLASAAQKFDVPVVGLVAPAESAPARAVVVDSGNVPGVSPKVSKWLKNNEISADHLEAVFHHEGDEIEIIASENIGESKKEQTLNAYLLFGAAQFIATGEGKFQDSDARDFCQSIGCYDTTNHATYLKEKGSLLAGSKQVGWTLTMPGLKEAALVVKAAR